MSIRPEDWPRVREGFEAALAVPATERRAYVTAACSGDGALLAAVEQLLASHERAIGFLETPAGATITEVGELAPTTNFEGLRIGPYQIAERIGAGGMGEVYRARDTKLGRDVAIKMLSTAFTSDPDRLPRFEREARMLAALNHPHIGAIYGLVEVAHVTASGRTVVPALVLELVEGPTLAERLKAGPLAVNEALNLARQIAEALAAAHGKGIIHRDLKPANITITTDGNVKVLDFGVAKMAAEDESRPDLSQMPIVSATGTLEGMILGTPAYMSPEQARGQAIDKRTDIWAFGCVVYEMLTGRSPFASGTVSDMISAVLERQPDWHALPRATPASLRRLLQRCLEKNTKRRLRDITEAEVELTAELDRRRDDGNRRLRIPAARFSRWAAAFAMVVTVAAAGAWLANLGGLRTGLAPGAGPPQIRAIAVLPFRNLSRDADQEYFADGMTEALTTGLAQISALNVISRTSVMRYQGTQKTTREIARELHVDAVVEGSAQRSGNRVLITAQLIEASSDRHLWAKSYERDLLDMLALQNEVAQAIAQEIQVRLTPQEQARLSSARPVNPEAQEAYARGRYWFQKGVMGWSRSFDYFQQAVAKDPSYAAAYAALSNGYLGMTSMGLLPAKEAYPKWRAAVTRALELDPNLADAYVARGELLVAHDRNWRDAERDFQRALQLNPNLADAHEEYAQGLATFGRLDEAVMEIRRAVELDPFSNLANFQLGYILVQAGRNDEALEQGRKWLEVNPVTAHRMLGLAYERKGNLDLAIAEFQQHRKNIEQDYPAIRESTSFPQSIAELAHAYAVAGRRREALQLLSELTEMSRRRSVFSWHFAIVYVGLGDKDRAFESLENGYDEEFDILKADYRMKPLRSDPRYHELLRRMGLPP